MTWPRNEINVTTGWISSGQLAGWLFSGFMVRIYAAAGAIWMAHEACSFVVRVFSTVQGDLPH